MNFDFIFKPRPYFKICTLLCFALNDVLAPLVVVYEDVGLSHSTVKDCSKRFRDEQGSLEDGVRNRRTKSAVTSGNILEIEWMVEDDAYITIKDISLRVGSQWKLNGSCSHYTC